MEKAKILAVSTDVKEREFGGRVIKEREIFLGWKRDGFDGYKPMVRAGISKNTNKPYGLASESIDVAVFGNYVPRPDDIVEVEFNRYGRIISVKKAAN